MSVLYVQYSTFHIEKKHGFCNQTIGLFVSDKIKSFFLTCFIGTPFVVALLKIIKVSVLVGGGDFVDFSTLFYGGRDLHLRILFLL